MLMFALLIPCQTPAGLSGGGDGGDGGVHSCLINARVGRVNGSCQIAQTENIKN